jgi:hypothetical protein
MIFPESLETIFCIKIPVLKFLDADANLGIFLALDPGWDKSDSGIRSGINIPDPQQCFDHNDGTSSVIQKQQYACTTYK